MTDPIADLELVSDALRLVEREAEAYVGTLSSALVRPPVMPRGGPVAALPDEGSGSLAALTELIAAAREGATRSTGPRFFHFVMGGGTAAALGADWLASTLDQDSFNSVLCPLC